MNSGSELGVSMCQLDSNGSTGAGLQLRLGVAQLPEALPDRRQRGLRRSARGLSRAWVVYMRPEARPQSQGVQL